MNPFWSPDGRFIGFFADEKLKTINISGKPPRTLCDAPSSAGGRWNRDGVILFALSATLGSSVIYRVPDTGGTPVAATTLDKTQMEVAHSRPSFMPDGHHFLFLATASEVEGNAVHIGTLDSPERRLVERVSSSAAYATPGYLLFARNGTLTARQFDEDRLEAVGDPMAVAEIRQAGNGAAAFSVSDTGTLVASAPRCGQSRHRHRGSRTTPGDAHFEMAY